MTNGELIEKLKGLPKNQEIYLHVIDGDNRHVIDNLESVIVTENGMIDFCGDMKEY